MPIFREERYCLKFFEVLAEVKNKWPAKLITYVLMPDHFHLIANPRDGNVRGFAGALKSKLARQVVQLAGNRFLVEEPTVDGCIHQVWQESFKAIPLWSSWMIWQKINYIHANPVKAGLVASAKHYPWSSFQAFYSGTGKPLPVDQDWWWPDDSMKLSAAMKQLGWRTYHKRSGDK